MAKSKDNVFVDDFTSRNWCGSLDQEQDLQLIFEKQIKAKLYFCWGFQTPVM